MTGPPLTVTVGLHCAPDEAWLVELAIAATETPTTSTRHSAPLPNLKPLAR